MKVDDGKNATEECPVSDDTSNMLNLADKVRYCFLNATKESCDRCRSEYKTLESNYSALTNACFDVENAVSDKNNKQNKTNG